MNGRANRKNRLHRQKALEVWKKRDFPLLGRRARRREKAKKKKEEHAAKVAMCNLVPIRQTFLDDFGWSPPSGEASKMVEWLKKKGFTHLGSGAYTDVLGKPGSDRVIRVTRTNDNWIDYIQWAAKKGYAGNFAPRVFSWKRRGNWSVSVVERMDRTLRQAYEHDFALLESLRYTASQGNLLAKVYMEDVLPGSAAFFTEVEEEFHASDIYGKNMMIRKDGTFCLTDPVCGRIKTDKTRLRSADLSATPVYGLDIESSYRHRSEWITQSY